MIDQFGRTIDYIRISVTDRCNLRCVYCMPEEGVSSVLHQEILTFDEIVRIVTCGVQLGISKVKVTGGEPLVRKNLAELIKKLYEIDGLEEVTLTTNGVLLKEQLSELVSAGVSAINISLDTLDEAHYKKLTRCGRLSSVLEGLEEALQIGQVKIKLNCVMLSETTAEEYCQLAQLAKEHPIAVRFIEMMPIGCGKNAVGRTEEEVLEMLRKSFGSEEILQGTFGNGPSTYVKFPGFCGEIGFISAMSHKFCDRCNRIRLTSEGFLKPCLQYAGGLDLRKLIREGVSDQELCEKIAETIYGKPQAHHFEKREEEGFEHKKMSEIGG